MNISLLPADILRGLIADVGICRFRSICRRFKAVSEGIFSRRLAPKFVAKFGTLAPCEREIPVAALWQQALEVEARSSQRNPRTIFTMKNGMPRLAEVPPHGSLEWRQFCVGGLDCRQPAQMQALTKWQQLQMLAHSQLSIDDLERTRPLHNQLERKKRLDGLAKAVTFYDWAIQASNRNFEQESYDFDQESWNEGKFAYLFSKTLALFQEKPRAILPTCCMPLAGLSQRTLSKKVALLGRTHITFRGENLPLLLQAQAIDLTSPNCSFFCIRQDTEMMVGSFEILHSGNRPLHLFAFEDGLGYDPETGDRPIARVLTQLFMELFQRETEANLSIHVKGNEISVLVAGGLLPHVRGAASLEGIRQARAQEKLFPPDREEDRHSVFHIVKSPSLAATIFVNRIGNRPLMVDFSLTEPPITWEEQIAKAPLITEIEGPLLPH